MPSVKVRRAATGAVGGVVLGTVLSLLWTPEPAAWSQPAARPASRPAGVDPARLAAIDEVVARAIAAGQLPGAVVVVGRGDAVLYEKAYGQRAVVPAAEPMTLDTVFDMASLTKVVATTTAVMQLVEQGTVRLTDPVASWVPGFERFGKRGITVRHLLTHVSGLRPDVDLGESWKGYEAAIDLAVNEVPTAPPGAQFVYSDINFFLLGHIVARASGLPLEQYVARHVFDPLGMADTGFLPPIERIGRIAPTERCRFLDAWPCKAPEVEPLRGVVHDPTARRMGGVAGHAGLFSTARDLTRFARMLLGGGALGSRRVLAPLTVAKMIAPATPAAMAARRGLGWDLDTSFSGNRGELMPLGSFGHTGFTGTSIWVDPRTRLFVIFLSSRLHPDGTGDVTPLRARVATLAAAAVTGGPGFEDPTGLQSTGTDFGASSDPARPIVGPPPVRVLTGIDVLTRDGFALLQGRRVGLVTNHTGRAASGATTIDLLYRAPGVSLVALFSPEHGIRGVLDADVPSSTDEATGLPIHSLYGDTRRPTDAMLEGIDTMVVDLQDVGARFYTYPATMGYVLEAAARRQIRVVVLDRPNPIGGWKIEGPLPDDDLLSFIAYLPMPIRHGLTLGELAQLFNAERSIGAELTVVRMEGWRRDHWFDHTGLAWVNPSPNMRNLTQATLYPGIGALEYGNLSVGRGTDQPFEQIGAPWIDGPRLAQALNARGLPGIRFYPVRFTPTSSVHAGMDCQGVFMVVTDRDALAPARVGIEIASALWRLHGDAFDKKTSERLLGSRADFARLRAGEDPAAVAAGWAGAEAAWRRLRAQYLLYP
ncbi:MAG: exo-beta-N-acetylmuramidase NamZ domain-containing protein [Vicinamibacterales bacterium]